MVGSGLVARQWWDHREPSNQSGFESVDGALEILKFGM